MESLLLLMRMCLMTFMLTSSLGGGVQERIPVCWVWFRNVIVPDRCLWVRCACRGAVRKRMNALDNERESRATDMLLNYETVKYFTSELFELQGYDRATRQYQVGRQGKESSPAGIRLEHALTVHFVAYRGIARVKGLLPRVQPKGLPPPAS